jgi:hypothetical protein
MHVGTHVRLPRHTRLMTPDSHPCTRTNTRTHTVVFGRVTEGMAVVKRMEAMGTSGGKPRARIVISDCGQVSHTESKNVGSHTESHLSHTPLCWCAHTHSGHSVHIEQPGHVPAISDGHRGWLHALCSLPCIPLPSILSHQLATHKSPQCCVYILLPPTCVVLLCCTASLAAAKPAGGTQPAARGKGRGGSAAR